MRSLPEPDDQGERRCGGHRHRSPPRSRFQQRGTRSERDETESSSKQSCAAATEPPLEGAWRTTQRNAHRSSFPSARTNEQPVIARRLSQGRRSRFRSVTADCMEQSRGTRADARRSIAASWSERCRRRHRCRQVVCADRAQPAFLGLLSSRSPSRYRHFCAPCSARSARCASSYDRDTEADTPGLIRAGLPHEGRMCDATSAR
jgi:hypothetical protein